MASKPAKTPSKKANPSATPRKPLHNPYNVFKEFAAPAVNDYIDTLEKSVQATKPASRIHKGVYWVLKHDFGLIDGKDVVEQVYVDWFKRHEARIHAECRRIMGEDRPDEDGADFESDIELTPVKKVAFNRPVVSSVRIMSPLARKVSIEKADSSSVTHSSVVHPSVFVSSSVTTSSMRKRAVVERTTTETFSDDEEVPKRAPAAAAKETIASSVRSGYFRRPAFMQVCQLHLTILVASGLIVLALAVLVAYYYGRSFSLITPRRK